MSTSYRNCQVTHTSLVPSITELALLCEIPRGGYKKDEEVVDQWGTAERSVEGMRRWVMWKGKEESPSLRITVDLLLLLGWIMRRG